MLEFDSRNFFRLPKEVQHQFIKMVKANKSKYLSGYHSFKHVLYALNSFFHLYDKWNKECSFLSVGLDEFLTAIVWHDCNYENPLQDELNTKIAIVSYAESNRGNISDDVIDIIKGLQFPHVACDSFDIQLARDLDMSTVLYPEYFDDFFIPLLTVEWANDNKYDIRRRCFSFIDNLKFYNPLYSRIWESLNKDVLKLRVEIELYK